MNAIKRELMHDIQKLLAGYSGTPPTVSYIDFNNFLSSALDRYFEEGLKACLTVRNCPHQTSLKICFDCEEVKRYGEIFIKNAERWKDE